MIVGTFGMANDRRQFPVYRVETSCLQRCSSKVVLTGSTPEMLAASENEEANNCCNASLPVVRRATAN